MTSRRDKKDRTRDVLYGIAVGSCFAFIALAPLIPLWAILACVGVVLIYAFYEWLYHTAPLGYEDETGFHYGEPPASWCDLEDDDYFKRSAP